MRGIFLFILAGCLAACSGGGGGSSGGSSPSTPTNGWTTYSVETASSLPTCGGEIVGRLYYVEDSQIFRVCKSTGWQTIALGNTTISNRLISNTATDYCTQYTGEACVFNGGQIVKYADGSVLILGGWTFLYSVSSPDNDTDHAISTISVLYPPEITVGYQKLSPLVARGSGYKSAFLVYTRSPESIKVIYDTDGDNVPEATDELLYTATLSSW